MFYMALLNNMPFNIKRGIIRNSTYYKDVELISKSQWHEVIRFKSSILLFEEVFWNIL